MLKLVFTCDNCGKEEEITDVGDVPNGWITYDTEVICVDCAAAVHEVLLKRKASSALGEP